MSVCGEMASYPQAIPLLIGLGVRKLGVGVSAIPQVKANIRTLNFRVLQSLADKACSCKSAGDIEGLDLF